MARLTSLETLDPAELRTLSGLVAWMVPRLTWRHNGLGLLQAYVHEGTTDEMRVHIWNSTLEREGIGASGLLHDHRFDLTSTVLLGDLEHTEYHLASDCNGPWALYEVVTARKAAAMGGQLAWSDMLQAIPGRYRADLASTYVLSGQRYSYPKSQFHGSRMHDDIVVTVVTKSNQSDVPARILAPFDKPVVHAFEKPNPPESWVWLLAETQARLVKLWKDGP